MKGKAARKPAIEVVEYCQAIVPRTKIKKWSRYGGMVCMRRKGHSGRHIGVARAALIADGFCPSCGERAGEHVCRALFWGVP